MRAYSVGVCPITRAHAIVRCTVGGRSVAEYRCTPAHADTIGGAFMAVGAAGAADVYAAIYADGAPMLPDGATIH